MGQGSSVQEWCLYAHTGEVNALNIALGIAGPVAICTYWLVVPLSAAYGSISVPNTSKRVLVCRASGFVLSIPAQQNWFAM